MEIINTLQFATPNRRGILKRFRDEDLPLRVYHNNLPSQDFFDKYLEAKNDLFAKTHGTIGLREADTDSSTGVKIHYAPYDSIGGAGWTIVDSSYADGTPRHIRMLIANDRGPPPKAFKREFARAIQTLNTIDDPMFIQAKESDALEYHVNEGDAFEIIYKLPMLTNTANYKYFVDTSLTDVKDINENIADFMLYQNYPNPFNASTMINYSVPLNRDGKLSTNNWVTLKIYNLLGQEVTTLINEDKKPGYYEVSFDASNLSSGVYYYVLRAGNFISTKKMLLVR
ncbi:MAG: T9SS type A sorting domain-containing protein [Bacteroidota bacterium]|nr:T9SS type A sorting domain-containing protein [Bacteroidota bacterium]